MEHIQIQIKKFFQIQNSLLPHEENNKHSIDTKKIIADMVLNSSNQLVIR